jgi:hypothetical protein
MLKELENTNKKLQEVIIAEFGTLFKHKGKSRTILIKSPLEKRSYKFVYQLNLY